MSNNSNKRRSQSSIDFCKDSKNEDKRDTIKDQKLFDTRKYITKLFNLFDIN